MVLVGISSFNSSTNLFTYNITNWNTISTVTVTNKRFQILSDVNLDGYPDLVVFDCNGVYVMMNNGYGYNSPKLWNTELNLCDLTPKGVADFYGDGFGDIYEFYNSDFRVALNGNKKIRIKSVTDSLKNEKIFTYDNLANSFYKKQDFHFHKDFKRFGLNMDIVSMLSTSDGLGGFTSIEYQYGNNLCNKIPRMSDCSFDWIKYKASDSKLYFMDEYFLNFPLTGLVKSKKSYLNEILISSNAYNYSVINNTDAKFTGGKGIIEILQTSIYNYFYDNNGVFLKAEISQFKHDFFGNIVFLVENVTNSIMNYSKVTSYTYNKSVFNLNNWNLAQLDSQTEYFLLQTNTKSENSIREQRFEYNLNTRLLSKKTYLPNSLIGLEQSFVYNQFGNINALTDKDLGTMETRTKQFNYDSNGLNILSSINALGQKKMYSYDLQDNIVKSTDPNGISNVYTYSSIGNKIFESINGFSNVSINFAWDFSTVNSIYSITKQTDGGQKIKTIYDSLNRVIRTAKSGYNSDIIFEDTIYDKNGLVRQKSMPYKAYVSEPYFVTIEYDELMREIKKTEPGKSNDQFNFFMTQYSGLNVIRQDSLGSLKVETKNILGQIIRIEDKIGSVSNYEYDLFNNLVKVTDPQGKLTSLKYNENNKLILKNDPYMGTEINYYNAFDELTRTQYANGQSVSYIRDALGRLIKRIEPEGETIWTYDTAKNGIGQIHKINSSAQIKEYAYDEFGRETEVKSQIKDERYSFRTNYDVYGRISAKIYPSNFTVYSCYNQNGYLASVSTTDQLCKSFIWKANDYDATNAIINEEDKNNIQTVYTYNNFKQITRIRSGRFNNVLRNFEYDYDLRKNLIKKSDDFRGKQTIDKYSYDSLDRLIFSSSLVRQDDGIEKMIKQSAWNYDSIGNILYSNDIDSLVYTYDKEKKQLPIKIGNESIFHDDRGNVIKTNSYEILWSSFSKPVKINTAEGATLFEYGSNRERIMKTTNDYKSLVHYVENLYEKWFEFENGTKKVSEKYYINVLNKIIAIKVVNNQDEKLYYLNNDAFGSIESINDENGNLLVKYVYSAYGSRTTSYSNISSEYLKFFNLGFSSNDFIVDNRLVHFKGRIFDCVFARFLNPDPFIQDPYNIQNLNRYSYGLNNPFKYNDPSGFSVESFFKKIINPKFLFAVVAAVATAGLLAPVAAGIAAGVTSTAIGASVVSGAIVGSGTGFVSSLILSNGNLNAAFKGALNGGLSGGIVSGLGSLTKASLLSSPTIKFAGDAAFNGVKNNIQGKKFFDGFDMALFSMGCSQVYQKIVGYETTYENGGPAAEKGYYDRPVKGANNIGTQGGPASFFSEGGPLSEALNKIGGFNAVAGMHDVFQISLTDEFYLRDVLNVPGMPVAAAITYGSLYSQIKCPMC